MRLSTGQLITAVALVIDQGKGPGDWATPHERKGRENVGEQFDDHGLVWGKGIYDDEPDIYLTECEMRWDAGQYQPEHEQIVRTDDTDAMGKYCAPLD